MITLLITTYTSRRDIYGNCYHAAIAVSTATSERVTFGHVGGESNMRMHARQAGVAFEQIESQQIVLPIREWNRLTKPWPYRTTEATIDLLRQLAQGEPTHAS